MRMESFTFLYNSVDVSGGQWFTPSEGRGFVRLILEDDIAGDKTAYAGAKARIVCDPMKPKAEALGYLEAKTPICQTSTRG